MFELINDSVGNNMTNDEDAVFNVKDTLSSFDRFEEEEPNGFITRDLDNSIKGFQRDNGLRVDGILRPGGETENGLVRGLEQRRADQEDGFNRAMGRLNSSLNTVPLSSADDIDNEDDIDDALSEPVFPKDDVPPIPDRKPEPPPPPEDGEEDRKKRERCAELGIELANARLSLESANESLEDANSRINPSLEEWRQAEREQRRIEGEVAMEVATAPFSRKGKIPFLGVGAIALSGKQRVDEAKVKTAEAKADHEQAKSDVVFYTEVSSNALEQIDSVREEMTDNGC